MRIGCLQFAPQVGDLSNNISRANSLLIDADPQHLDLLVLPELAFTGYSFKSLEHINPFLEHQGSGISAEWARRVAAKLHCIVTVGYPEKVDEGEDSSDSPTHYNSVIAVTNTGDTVAHYRKTFLYYTDVSWASEGPERFYRGLIPGLGVTAMGICMDINPYKFQAPWSAFEFASHCLSVAANLVIITMAWNSHEEAQSFSRTPNQPDMRTLSYWVNRLRPVIDFDRQEEVIIIFCNRCGTEGDTVYAGTSTVIGVKDGYINVYGVLGRGEENLLVVDTNDPPCGELVFRTNRASSTVNSDTEEMKDDTDTSKEESPSTTQSLPQSTHNTTTNSNYPQSQSKRAPHPSKQPHYVYGLGPGSIATSASSPIHHPSYVPRGLNGPKSTGCVIRLPHSVSSPGLSIPTSPRVSDRLVPRIAVRGQSPARADSPTLGATLFAALRA